MADNDNVDPEESAYASHAGSRYQSAPVGPLSIIAMPQPAVHVSQADGNHHQGLQHEFPTPDDVKVPFDLTNAPYQLYYAPSWFNGPPHVQSAVPMLAGDDVRRQTLFQPRTSTAAAPMSYSGSMNAVPQAMISQAPPVAQPPAAQQNIAPAPVLPPASTNQQNVQLPVPAPVITRPPATQANTPKNIDLRTAIDGAFPLPPCDISAVELLTCFPKHTLWPRVLLRLLGNGWSSLDIAKGQLHPRGNLTKVTCDLRNDAVRHQKLKSGAIEFGIPNFAPARNANLITPVQSWDPTQYIPRPGVNLKAPATLMSLDVGMTNLAAWPLAADSGFVTQAIRHAVNTNNATLTTADTPHLAALHNWVMSTRPR